MLSLIFVIGIVNLIVGFVLAVRLERPIVLYVPDLRRRHDPAAADSQLQSAEASSGASLVPAKDLTIDQVPGSWLAMLDDAELEANSFVEASVQVMRLQVGVYREDLLDIEERIRAALAKQAADVLNEALRELITLNDDWMSKQAAAVRELTSRRGQFGHYNNTAERLENLLLDQTPLIENHCKCIREVELPPDENAAAILIQEIGNLVGLAHELRDAMHESLVAIMRYENRLDSFNRREQFDPLTKLLNRLGIELVFRNWWREDAARARLISVGMMDVDRFAKVNELVSTRTGDRVLGTLGRLLDDVVSGKNGLHRVFRFAGQRFLVFFADTGPRSAAEVLERTRLTIEATTFERGDRTFSVTVSAGVTEILIDEETSQLFDRLDKLTEAAKRAGRNRTCLDEGEGSEIIQPRQETVSGRLITMD